MKQCLYFFLGFICLAHFNAAEALNYGEEIDFSYQDYQEIFDYSEAKNEKKEKANFKNPRRQVSIIASKEGYYPKSVTVFKGEKVHFFVTGTEKEANCFMLNEKSIFLSANKGRITEASAVFENEGKYSFYCPSSKIRGSLTVLERPSLKRKIASIPTSEKRRNPRNWVPKDF